MSKFCCITDLIQFMMKEVEKTMKGSVHEDDLFTAHDALVLMTAKKANKWMKEKNCFHCWLLPMNGLQDGTTYAGRPKGNSPEFMPLDNSLNRDILQSLRFHCVLSRFWLEGGGNRRGGEEYAIQFLYTKGNFQRTETYMGIENRNPFFGEDYPRCRSGVESVGDCLP